MTKTPEERLKDRIAREIQIGLAFPWGKDDVMAVVKWEDAVKTAQAIIDEILKPQLEFVGSDDSYQYELDIITDFYNTRVAKRSQVPLINHITEGIDILKTLNASTLAIKAFCIHPIVQNNEGIDCSHLDSYTLAVEYKSKANSYLCKAETDWIKDILDISNVVGDKSIDCAKMLYADKLQNRKDFLIYHYSTHHRGQQLLRYFNLWLSYLDEIIQRNNKNTFNVDLINNKGE